MKSLFRKKKKNDEAGDIPVLVSTEEVSGKASSQVPSSKSSVQPAPTDPGIPVLSSSVTHVPPAVATPPTPQHQHQQHHQQRSNSNSQMQMQQENFMHPQAALQNSIRPQISEAARSPKSSTLGSMSAFSPQLHGAKWMTGPPPPGVKIMMKGPPLPPGVKLMKGPPPPGMMKKKMMPNMVNGKMPMVGVHQPKSPQQHQPPQSPPQQHQPAPSPPPLIPVKAPSRATSPGIKSPPLSSTPGRLPPRKSVPSLPASKQMQATPLLTVSPSNNTKSPRKKSSAASQEKEHVATISYKDDIKEKSHNSFSVPDEMHVKEMSLLELDAPRNASEIGSELQFVIEAGSPNVRSPTSQESPKRLATTPSKGSMIHFNAEESARSVSSFFIQNDEPTATQRSGNTPRKTLLMPTGSMPNTTEIIPLDHSNKLGGGKKEADEQEHIRNASSSPRRGSERSKTPAEKNRSTPKRKEVKKMNIESETNSDISPAVLDHTLIQNRGGGTNPRAFSLPQSDEEHNYNNNMPLSEGKLSPGLRNRIVEQFFSILSPQQFYGKVTKLHRIQLVKNDPERAPGIKEYKTIFVATKGILPNQFFYPQLRLMESECPQRGSHNDQAFEYVDTPIVLYEAAPGNMLFVETELEAKHTLDTNPSATSCFVLEKSAIVFKDPLKYVLPIAMLTVRWIPYSLSLSEPQCPVHHRELQLFDRHSKELHCALCVSKNASHAADLIVIPEVLNGDSRRQILERLTQQLQEKQQIAARWVSQHQRVVSIAKHKKEAVNQQFDLLIAAIQVKRNEFLEQCDAAFGYSLSSIAKEILTEDEHMRLLKAAIDHLRTDGTKPLYSMQIATVANALHASDEFPKPMSLDSLQLSVVTTELTPNLGSAMAEIQSLTPMWPRTKASRPRSPFSALNSVNERKLPHETEKQLYPEELEDFREVSQTTIKNSQLEEVPLSSRIPRNDSHWKRGRSKGHVRITPTPHKKSAYSPQRRSVPLLPRDDDLDFELNGSYSQRKRQHPHNRHNQGQWVAIPRCHGTCILNVPLQHLLAIDDKVRNALAKPQTLQWVLRIDDPGEWVGIGVGIGGSLKTWAANRTPDLSHLWVIASSDTRHTFVLRVTVNPSVKHAKLSIHDGKGRQLDDGRIPQWNATRTCYPQVTFGGRIGEVHLMDGPRFVKK